MNWTGGSLQRHSKANANTLVKKQKQHFAKARLQSRSRHIRLSSAGPSIAELPQYAPLLRKRRSSPIALGTQDSTQKSVRGNEAFGTVWRLSENPNSQFARREPSNQSTEDEAGRQDNPGVRAMPSLMFSDRQPDDTNGVDHARKDLLETSDWVGLTTMRPARFNRSVRDEMEKVGRRRKITSLKRRRAGLHAHADGQTYHAVQPARQVPSVRTEDISVRVGSNIHRTQTTPSNCAGKGSTQLPENHLIESAPLASSRDELGSADTGLKTSENGNRSFWEKATAGQTMSASDSGPQKETCLIPLNRAIDLNLSSWDMIREHSSRSGSQTNARVSILPSDPSFLSPLDGEFGMVVKCNLSPEVNTNDEAAILQDYASVSITQNIVQRGIAVGVLETAAEEQPTSPPFIQQDVYQKLSSPVRTKHAKLVQSPTLPSLDAAVSNLIERSPRFTLESQVELERTVQGLENRANSSGNVAFAPPPGDRHVRLADEAQALPGVSAFHRGLGPQSTDHRFSPILASKMDVLQTSSGLSLPTRHSSSVSLRCHNQDDGQTLPNSTCNKVLTPTPNATIENDTWMKFVFPDDFRKVQHGFQFDNSHLQHKPKRARGPAKSFTNELISVQGGSGSLRDREHSSYSNHTGANTSLFIPSQQNCDPSETDFLSYLSPMEGCLDERVVDVSVYNNPARTEHSSWTTSAQNPQRSRLSGIPSEELRPKLLVPAKRTASHLLERETANPRLRHIYESATSPVFSDDRSSNHSTGAMQRSAGRHISRKSPIFRTPQRSAVTYSTNRVETMQARVQDYSARSEQSLGPTFDRRRSPASIFIPSDGLAAESSSAVSTGMAARSMKSNAPTESCRLWSDVSHDSTGLSDPNPARVHEPVFFSSRDTPAYGDTKSNMVNIHTASPRRCARPHRQLSTQIPLWGRG